MKYYDKVKQMAEATIESTKKMVSEKLPVLSKHEKTEVVEDADVDEGIAETAENAEVVEPPKGELTTRAQDVMMRTLNWAYDYAISDNVPGVSSISKVAEDFLKKSDSVTEACNSMIRWQLAYAGGLGFVTNLGGMITLPVSIPSNIASVLYIQIRMIAAVAYMGGYDLKSEQVRTSVFLSLLGGSANIVLDSVGVQLATKLTTNAIKQIPGTALTKINQAVGFRLVTKFGTTGVLNMGKIVPVVGGLVGGTLDVLTTNVIANAAKKMFLEDTIEKEKLDEFEILRIKALINMAKIDGDFSVEEQQLIQGIIDNSMIPDSKKQELNVLIEGRELIKVDLSIFKKHELYGFSLLNSLVSVVLADGKIEPAERLYLKKVAKEIGISSNEITEILDSFTTK